MTANLFELTRISPDKNKQNYLDSLDLGENRKYVRKLRFSNQINPKKPNAFMAMPIPPITTFLGIKGIKSEIIVYPTSFLDDAIRTEEDFLSLLDHEIRHAWQVSTLNFLPSSKEIFKDMLGIETFSWDKLEYDAYTYQMNLINSGMRKASPQMILSVKANIKRLERLL